MSSPMPRSAHRLRAALCVLSVGAPLALAACPGHLDDTAPYLAALEGAAGAGGSAGSPGVGGMAGQGGSGGCGDVPTTVLLLSCGPQGCHGGPNPASKLDLASAGVASRVVGVPGFACGSILADPQNPTGSLIYSKIATPVPDCGGRMPLGLDPLGADAIACVAAWIGSLPPATDAGM